jgi:hypothetical protein
MGFVRRVLTPTSVVAVMRMSVMTVPNPRALGEGPEYWVGRVHDVWPFKLGLRLALIIAVAKGADIPLRQDKVAKE